MPFEENTSRVKNAKKKINGNAQSFLHKNFVGTLNPIFVIYRTELKSKGTLHQC